MTVFATEVEQSVAEVSVAGDFKELSQTEQKAVLKKLVHEAEEASEGAEQKSFFKTYAQKANLPKVMLGMLRWYETKKSDYPTIAADLSLLLLTSHSMEMLSGPIGAAWSQSQHLPIWVTSAIATVGGIISIPGLDPLCMLLGFTYVKSAKFRNGVGVTRIFLKHAVDKSGLEFVLSRGASVFVRQVPRGLPPSLDASVNSSVKSSVMMDFYLEGDSKSEPWLSLEIRNEQSEQGDMSTRYVHQATFDPKQRALIRDEQLRVLKTLLGFNAAQAVIEIISQQKLQPDLAMQSAFHILNDSRQDDELLRSSSQNTSDPRPVYTITFRPHSLPISEKRWVLSPWLLQVRSSCQRLLGGK
jgi:hypothetical protein